MQTRREKVVDTIGAASCWAGFIAFFMLFSHLEGGGGIPGWGKLGLAVLIAGVAVGYGLVFAWSVITDRGRKRRGLG